MSFTYADAKGLAVIDSTRPGTSWLVVDPEVQAWIALGNTPAPYVPPPAPPLTATPYQFKAALVQQGLYAQATAAVAAADQLTQLAWAEAQTFIENDPVIVRMTAALGKTTADVHALFQLAQTLNP